MRRGPWAGGFALFLLPIGVDDLAVVLGAAVLIEQAVGYRALAADTVLAIELIAFLLERLRLRSNMNLRLAKNPLLLERARVVLHIDAFALHEAVEMVAPALAHVGGGRARRHLPAMLLGLAHVARTRRRADNLAARVDIGVLEHDMRMRIVRVFAAIVVRRAPGDAALAEFLHKALDDVVALLLIELDRQRDHELVGDARVLRHPGLFPELVEEDARAASAVRHVLALKFRHRFRAHDVAHMRRRRPGLVRLGPDARVLESGKRFCAHDVPLINYCCFITMT